MHSDFSLNTLRVLDDDRFVGKESISQLYNYEDNACFFYPLKTLSKAKSVQVCRLLAGVAYEGYMQELYATISKE